MLSSHSNKNILTVVEKLLLEKVRQGIQIHYTNVNNPVLLFLHGGPGVPESGAVKQIAFLLAPSFTIVHWDQRGAGMSYSSSVAADSMNMQQLVQDLHILIQYLLKKFNKEKVLLVGHSWGTCIGLNFAKLYPQLLSGYIGISQVINRKVEETRSYYFALESARTNRNLLAYFNLKKIKAPVNGYYSSLKAMTSQRSWVSYYRGFSFQKRKNVSLFKDILTDRSYSAKDKFKLLKGISFSLKNLWDDFANTDFTTITSFDVPVYFIMGEKDRITFPDMVSDYLNTISAPNKNLFILPGCAHMVWYEDPGTFYKILTNKIRLQD